MNSENDEYIINSLKSSPNLQPNIDFVHRTKYELIQRAQGKMEKKKQYWKYSIGIGIMACVIMFFAFGDGIEINNKITTIQSSVQSEKQEPLIFIYHTHNRESFLPNLQSSSSKKLNPKDVNSEDLNITLVGKRLATKLNELGINTLVDQTDYAVKPNFNWNDSYKLSKVTLNKVLDSNNTLKMVFDIHRDTKKRDMTTIVINEKKVAKITFVVSESNPKYQENMKFASKLYNELEKVYPGLANPVTTSSKQTYNQDLHSNSLLIEIGGFENSLEEEYLTVEMIANVIAELVKENK